MTLPVWSTAIADWEHRIINRLPLIPFQPLFPSSADEGLNIFKSLILADVTDKPTIGEACAPWVFDFAGAVFGSYDPFSRKRLISEYFLLISKKNSKSTLAGGIMLTELILNERESAEFLILAPTKEVADNAYKPIRDMIKNDEELEAMFLVQDHVRTVTHRVTNAILKVVAADTSTVSGKKATGVLVDELWEFGKNPHADNMLLEATGGLASRPEGFVIYLTTQSDTPPAGVFSTKLKYARDVRDGVVEDPSFLPVLYEHPKSIIKREEHLLSENFYMTNPNIGKSVSQEYLDRKYAQAKIDGKKALTIFLAKHANVEIGMALRADRWAGADYWEKTADPEVNLQWMLRNCEVITAGGDGGGLDDLLGLSMVGRRTGTKEWVSWSHAWAHKIALERRKQEAARLLDFEKDGDLTIIDEIGEDTQQFAHFVMQAQSEDLLFQMGLDPAAIGGLIDDMLLAGIPEEKIVGVSQGWKLAGAIYTAERKLAEEGKFKHAAQPLMNWCVGNAKVEPRANSILITKQVSGSGKIDPLMALFNAVTLMSLNPPAQKQKFQMFVLG